MVIKAEEHLTFTSRWDPQWEVTLVRGPVVWIPQQQTGKNKVLNREKVMLVDPEITLEDINPRPIRDQRRRAVIPPPLPNLAANRSQAAPSTPPSVPQDDPPAEVLGSTNPPATPTQATADQQTGTDPPLSPRRGSTHEQPMEADSPPPQTSILEHPPMDVPAPPLPQPYWDRPWEGLEVQGSRLSRWTWIHNVYVLGAKRVSGKLSKQLQKLRPRFLSQSRRQVRQNRCQIRQH